MPRLEQLLAFLAEDPNDPFNVYAVALEYQKTDTARALTFFFHLIEKFPDYVPAYYSFGKLLCELNQIEKAKEIFSSGIQKARAQNEVKAARELRSALDELEW